MRLIDADNIPNYEYTLNAICGDKEELVKVRIAYWEDIERVPTIKSNEFTTRWIESEIIDNPKTWYCMMCGNSVESKTKPNYNFCPECGRCFLKEERK